MDDERLNFLARIENLSDSPFKKQRKPNQEEEEENVQNGETQTHQKDSQKVIGEMFERIIIDQLTAEGCLPSSKANVSELAKKLSREVSVIGIEHLTEPEKVMALCSLLQQKGFRERLDGLIGLKSQGFKGKWFQ